MEGDWGVCQLCFELQTVSAGTLAVRCEAHINPPAVWLYEDGPCPHHRLLVLLRTLGFGSKPSLIYSIES